MSERVRFVGIDPPEDVTSRGNLEEGERERGWGAWVEDLYGVGAVLAGKRERRGWREERVEMLRKFMGEDTDVVTRLKRFEGEGGDMVMGLVEWKGGMDGREVFPGRLPWEETGR